MASFRFGLGSSKAAPPPLARQMSMDELVLSIFEKPVARSCVGKDIPRLADRITVRASEVGTLIDATAPEPSVGAGAGASVSADAGVAAGGAGAEAGTGAGTEAGPEAVPKTNVTRVVEVLAGVLEPERVDEVAALCRELFDGPMSRRQDPTENCLALLEALGGEESKVVRVLKLLNQNMVLAAISVLRDRLPPSTPLTKDVRTKEGWLVDIEIYDAITVRHKRREQSLDMFGDTTNHMEFAFEVSATLDSKVEGVTATGVRITDLQLSPDMDADLRNQLQMTFAAGNLIIS